MNNAYPTPMHNARRWIMCLSLMACVALHAQDKIEYFWNTDPGIGKGTKVAVTNGTVSCALSTEALAEGPNLLGIRAIDGDNYSSTLLRTVFKVALFDGNAKVEYFWDTDPGIGNATNYPVTLSGSEPAVTLSLPTDGIANGAHLLGMRVYNGCWSHTYYYIVAVANNGALADKVEYFWDDDPGIGLAIQQPLTVDGSTAIAALEIPTDTLKGGVHLLGMRVGCGEQWSSTLTRIVAVAPNNGAIERVEYFWDTDPGIGNATDYPVNANGSHTTMTLDIPTDTLSTGVHLLGLRSFCGEWSSTLLHYVAVSATGGAIERVEYYWNEDPGYGQATALPFTGDALAFVDTEIVSPADYGTHVLHIRALSNGMWSTPYVQKFCINAIPAMELPSDTVCVGEQFIVYNMTEGATDATTYSWDMNGDGKEDSQADDAFVYTYTKAGNYMATLSVKTVGDCENTCHVPIVVLPTDAPKVSLSASAKTICDGDAVRLQATAMNAGDRPEYEWLLNGEVIATTTADTLMMETLAHNDKVQVRVISSNPCATVDNALSAAITFRVNALPEVSIAHYFPLHTSESAVILSGGLPEGGTYYIDGKEAQLFNPKRNTTGSYQLTYSYTNSNGCTSEAVTTLLLRDGTLLLGDVNKDEQVDVMDVLCEVDLVYGRTFPTYTLSTADINGDKSINVADIVGVSGIILDKHAVAKALSVQRRAAQGGASQYGLAAPDAYANGMSEVLLHFNLSSTAEVSGVQFDVTLPEGVELSSATQGLLVGRKAGATDNTYTLLAYSSSLGSVPGTLTVKASLPVNLADGMYALSPTDVILVDADMNTLSYTLSSGSLHVGEATGMDRTIGGIQVDVTDSGLRIIEASGSVAMLTDAAGRFILAEELVGDDCLLPLGSLPTGTYVIEIVTESSTVKAKFLWK